MTLPPHQARRHAMPFGTTLLPDGGVRFRLWAPGQAEIRLALDGTEPLPLQALPPATSWTGCMAPAW
jgi:1,4-alpha-glucan branching enzyme